MNGFILLIPLLTIRYFVLGRLSKRALNRAAHFAPLEGNEKLAFVIYQISTILIFVVPIFERVKTEALLIVGIAVYATGLITYIISVIDYSKPTNEGLNVNGIYRYSRNSMYVAQFCLLDWMYTFNSIVVNVKHNCVVSGIWSLDYSIRRTLVPS